MWERYIENCGEVTLEVTTKNKGLTYWKNKLETYIPLYNFYKENKNMLASEIVLPFSQINTIDNKNLKDIIYLQRALAIKWKGRFPNSEYLISKENMMGDFKPCCVFSFYGALLTSFGRNSDSGYPKRVWKTFMETLRIKWDSTKETPL